MPSPTVMGWCLAFWVVVFLSSIQNASGQSARPEEVKFSQRQFRALWISLQTSGGMAHFRQFFITTEANRIRV